MVFAPHWYDLKTLFRLEFNRLSVNLQGIHLVSICLREMQSRLLTVLERVDLYGDAYTGVTSEHGRTIGHSFKPSRPRHMRLLGSDL